MHTLQQLRSGELAGATRLDLSCGLREFPREIFELADSLEVLNLSGNAWTACRTTSGGCIVSRCCSVPPTTSTNCRRRWGTVRR